KMTLLEVAARALKTHDPDCVERLIHATRALGVDVVTEAKPIRVTADGGKGRWVVVYEREGRTESVRAALVANGSGRIPEYEGLELASAGIALPDGTPRLDGQLRCLDNPRVWFVGDARPGPQLSPVATYDGHVVGRAILGGAAQPDYSCVPSVVYTIPPLASVGRTVADAE